MEETKNWIKVANIAVCAIIAIAFLAASFCNKKYDPDGSTDFFEKNYASPFTKPFSDLGDTSLIKSQDTTLVFQNYDVFKDIYNWRLEAYQNDKTALWNVTHYLITLLIIAFLILVYEIKEWYTIPVLAMKVPYKMLFVFTMISLLLLWIQYGSILNKALDSRMALHSISMLMETNTKHMISYEFSNVNNLVDHGIIDVWCNHFYDFFKSKEVEKGETAPLAPVTIYVVFCVFWAGVRVTVILMATLFYTKGKSILSLFFLVLSYVVFILCELGFSREFNHAALVIGVVWSITTLIVFLLTIKIIRKKFIEIMR